MCNVVPTMDPLPRSAPWIFASISTPHPQGAASVFMEMVARYRAAEHGYKAYLNTVQCRSASSFHAVSCAAGTPCNEISGNTAVDDDNNPTDGAVVLLAGGGSSAAMTSPPWRPHG